MKPVFIISLPRSGSTLLQRILMTHSKIASTAEPWLLLPLAYTFKNQGIAAEYSHVDYYRAQGEFLQRVPNGKAIYQNGIAQVARQLYEAASGPDHIYFLDKTPRYHLIIPELAMLFPDAKFIFLLRNPVHVYASIVSTFCQNKLRKLFNYHIDLHQGVANLTEGLDLLGEKAMAIRYEDLVLHPAQTLEKVCLYLDIAWEPNIVEGFNEQAVDGNYGDPTGKKQLTTISTVGLDRWKKVFNTWFRKRMLMVYLKSLPVEVLSKQDYDKAQIVKEVKALRGKPKKLVKDPLDYWFSQLARKTKAFLFVGKNAKWAKGKHLR